jgi:hypothetical protein
MVERRPSRSPPETRRISRAFCSADFRAEIPREISFPAGRWRHARYGERGRSSEPRDAVGSIAAYSRNSNLTGEIIMKTKQPTLTAFALLSLLAVPLSAQVSASGGGSAPGASSSSTSSASATTPSATSPSLPSSPANPNLPAVNPPSSAVNPPSNAVNPNLNPVNPNPNPVDPNLNPVNPTTNSVNPTLNPVNPSPNAVNPNLGAVNPPTGAVNPGTNPVNPTIPNSSGVNAGAARSGAVSGSTSTADTINSSLAGSAAAQGDVPSANINNRGANARANGQVLSGQQGGMSGLATGGELSAEAASVLSPADAMRDIRSASQSSRDGLYSRINSRLENSGRITSSLESRGRDLKGDAKTEFKAAADDLRDREKALRRSLNEVRKASNDNWSEAQAQLASDYEAYAAAVARAQAAANTSGSATSNMSR